MDLIQSNIITIISIIVTVFAIIYSTYQSISIRNRFIPIPKERRKALEGEWKGNIKQNNLVDNKNIIGSNSFSISTRKRKIFGSIIVDLKLQKDTDFHNFKLRFEGGFKDNRFLTLNYVNSKGSIVQFGNMIFELSPDSEELKGEFVGFGPVSRQIITGNILLKKIDKEKAKA